MSAMNCFISSYPEQHSGKVFGDFYKNNCSVCIKIVYLDLSCGKEQKIAYVCFRFSLIKHVSSIKSNLVQEKYR